jgi:4-amino-4-deoxy-L-arabinose transferase-like glycosyltransferase
MAVPLVFFSFSGSKLPGYILPAVPAAIILSADYVYRFIQKSDLRRYAVQTVAAVTFLLVAVAAVMFGPRFADADSVKSLFAAADGRGLRDAPVIMLHGISHNAEFYAAGRIVREADGKQKRFFGPREVSEELRKHSGQSGLVIVPIEYLAQLLSSEYLQPELIKENGEVALVAVKEK